MILQYNKQYTDSIFTNYQYENKTKAIMRKLTKLWQNSALRYNRHFPDKQKGIE